MRWCQTCGEQYEGSTHNCGYVRISKDRLRELEKAERSEAGDLDTPMFDLPARPWAGALLVATTATADRARAAPSAPSSLESAYCGSAPHGVEMCVMRAKQRSRHRRWAGSATAPRERGGQARPLVVVSMNRARDQGRCRLLLTPRNRARATCVWRSYDEVRFTCWPVRSSSWQGIPPGNRADTSSGMPSELSAPSAL